jgi:hypothetical protein
MVWEGGVFGVRVQVPSLALWFRDICKITLGAKRVFTVLGFGLFDFCDELSFDDITLWN